MFYGCRHADHSCRNEHIVVGVAHVEQELAADGYDRQDVVDDDDDDNNDDEDDDVVDNQDDELVYIECECWHALMTEWD